MERGRDARLSTMDFSHELRSRSSLLRIALRAFVWMRLPAGEAGEEFCNRGV